VRTGISGTSANLVSTQKEQILDSVTVAERQSITQIRAMRWYYDGKHRQPTKRTRKSMANTSSHSLGRSIRRRKFRTNRTHIEVRTQPSDVMESKIDRQVMLVEELSQKCLVRDHTINQLTNYVSMCTSNLGRRRRSNQLRMTATDASIRESSPSRRIIQNRRMRNTKLLQILIIVNQGFGSQEKLAVPRTWTT
jgi:hypothetical protein